MSNKISKRIFVRFQAVLLFFKPQIISNNFLVRFVKRSPVLTVKMRFTKGRVVKNFKIKNKIKNLNKIIKSKIISNVHNANFMYKGRADVTI